MKNKDKSGTSMLLLTMLAIMFALAVVFVSSLNSAVMYSVSVGMLSISLLSTVLWGLLFAVSIMVVMYLLNKGHRINIEK